MRILKTQKFRLIIILLISFHFLLLLNLKFTVWPEMILYPYLQLKGFLLYRDIVNPYFPLLPLTSAFFFQLVGLSVFNLKLFTWLIIISTDFVFIFVSSLFYKQRINQVLAFTVFILLQIFFDGNGLWFELAVSPFVLLSLSLVYFYPKNLKKMLIAGVLFSCAVLIKQNAMLFLLPIGIFLSLSKNYRSLLIFLFTQIILLAITAALIFHAGLWSDFYSWAIKLSLSLSRQHGFVLLPNLHQYIIIVFPLVVLIPLVINKKYRLSEKIFWILSLLISLVFAFPRFEYFHLQVLVTLSCIFVPMLPKKIMLFFLLTTLCLFIIFLSVNFRRPDRFIDIKMLNLAQMIKNYPSVYILNGAETSYFFANKLPPKPWGTNFPWYFESNNFENTFINSLQQQKTEYIVIGDPIGGGKYDIGNYLPAGLLNYIQYNYSKTEKFESYTIWHRKLSSP